MRLFDTPAMELDNQKVIFLLAFLLFSGAGTIEVEAIEESWRSPLSVSQRKLLMEERESFDSFPSNDQQDPQKVLPRVRRLLDPDAKPKVNEVQGNSSGGDNTSSLAQHVMIALSDTSYPPVHSVEATIVDVTTVVVTWKNTNHSDIKTYQIKMKHQEGSATHNTIEETVETHYTFKYLNFSTTYSFEVQTMFKGNNFSDPVSVNITTGSFSAPVGPLNAIVHMDKTVTLWWSAPRTINPLTAQLHYKVYWNCSKCYPWFKTVGSATVYNETNITLNNLHPGESYLFRVHAETHFGVGKNATISVTISKNSARVQNLTAAVVNYTMTIHWNPPKIIDPNEIKRYEITWAYYCATTSSGHWLLRNVSEKVTQFKMDVLAGYNYTVYVYAVTSYGQGGWKNVKISVQPLDLKVSYAHLFKTGKYRPIVFVDWHGPYGVTENMDFEVSWHCVRGGDAYCWYNMPSSGWPKRVVSSHFLTVNLTRYDTAYEFNIVVITSRGRGKPYQVVTYIPPLDGIPGNFHCNISNSSMQTYLACHWSKPLDVDQVGFHGYFLIYRCVDCLSSVFHYEYIYSFNQTCANLSTVDKGARYTVSIQVNTLYGDGKLVRLWVLVPSPVRPVRHLTARGDISNANIVHLSWSLPLSGIVQYYVVVTTCSSCNTTTMKYFVQAILLRLLCGNTYTFSVRAVVDGVYGPESKVTFQLPSNVGPVTNLAIKFFSSEESQEFDDAEEKLRLTWSKPQDVNSFEISYYMIIVRRGDSGRLIFYTYASGLETHWTFRWKDNENLVAGENYSFEVRCSAGYRSCFGKSNTISAFFPVGQVRNLVAVSDTEKPTLVHILWNSPITRVSVQYYKVAITCSSCGVEISTVTFHPYHDHTLPCGYSYTIAVQAVINGIFSKETKTILTVEDPKIGAVTSLAVQYVSGKNEGSEGGFHLTWSKPVSVKSNEIEFYEIVVLGPNGDQPVPTAHTNKTRWTIRWKDSFSMKSGQNYTFQVRCATESCYGPISTVSGKAPSPSSRVSDLGPVVWAVPVALVCLILIAVIIFFVKKSRRLERSMLAIMTSRTVDNESVVSFRSSGDEVPVLLQ
ncbi:uncharacterized protein [Montipora capricornis]|uniref:uncharacterized protein isoform X1 n=2 Tax=Montipora capricornis TaxID=246305 RepID=UPI0035F191CD